MHLASALLMVALLGGPPAGGPYATATFAGGCFWSMEHPFDVLDGVVSVTVGYMGGSTPNPTYEQVSVGATGHLESVQVVYDPRKVAYETLLSAFWHNIDPLTLNGQFCASFIRPRRITSIITARTPLAIRRTGSDAGATDA